MGAGLGFGLDMLGGLGGYFEDQKLTNQTNKDIQIQNQLKINAYKTKQRNAELAWRNDKQDSDIQVDNKWRETKDALSESQINLKKAAGEAAISQQRILAQIMSDGGGEQAGRRTGRGKILELGAKSAAISARAAFDKKSGLLFRDKSNRNLTAFAQGEYVKYITGVPSPEAPPLLQGLKPMPSFFNTAVGILGSGLNRYQEWQDKKAPDAYEGLKIKGVGSYEDYTKGAFQEQPSWNFSPEQTPSTPWQTMELPTVTSQADTFLQQDMDNFFDAQKATKASNDLGIDNSVLFGE